MRILVTGSSGFIGRRHLNSSIALAISRTGPLPFTTEQGAEQTVAWFNALGPADGH